MAAIVRSVLAAGTAAIFAISGCSRESPERPPEPRPASPAARAWGPPEVATRDVTERDVVASKGAEVRAADGAALRLEPGALSRDAKVRITKLVPEPAEERVTVYDVDLGGASLTRAVSLDLPIEHPEAVSRADQVRVTQLDASHRWRVLPGTLSADRSKITVKASHFSPVRKEEPTIWAQAWFAADRRSPKILDVPYYNQADYGWCWAASLAMIEGSLGRTTKPWEVAQAFGARPETGSVGESALARYLERRGMSAEYKRWWGLWSLAGYIAHQIDQGRPVWIGLPQVNHVVVVVGYSDDAVFVHDPSGIFFQYALGEAEAQDPARLGRKATAWTWWDAIAAGRTAGLRSRGRETEWAQWNPVADVFPNETLVVTSAVPPGRPLSLHLMPRRAGLHIEHRRDLAWPKMRSQSVLFMWDGLAAEGWTFDHDVPGVSADTDRERALCNSDVVKRVKLSVSNTGSRPAKVTVTAALDGTTVATADAVLPIATQHPMELTLDGPLSDATTPLALGDRTLELVLSADGTPQDRATLRFTMLPAMVPGVKVTQQGAKVRLSWSPALEEGSAPRLVYRIYRTPGSSSAGRQLMGEVPRGVRSHELDLPEDQAKQRARYSVWAYDPVTNLESMDAAYLEPEAEDPPAAPPPSEIRVLNPVEGPVTKCAPILGMPTPGCEE